MAAGLGTAGSASGPPEAAVQPWRTATAETEPRRFMLAHGLLAPNPHNRQPWIADLREPGRIHLLCDGERSAPRDPLFAAIARRHTAKTAYAEGRPLPEALASA